MKIVILETFVVVVGALSALFGALTMNHYAEKAAAAKSIDQTHRCVAAVVHQHLFWSVAGADGAVQTAGCGVPDECSRAQVLDDWVSATLIVAVVNTTAAYAGACHGVAAGAQIVLPGMHMEGAVAQRVLADAIGRVGQYHVRYSGVHGATFIYNASPAAPAVGNTLVASTADPPMEYWKRRGPLGAALMLVGFAMIVCGVFVDTHRGGTGIVIDTEDEDLEMDIMRSDSAN